MDRYGLPVYPVLVTSYDQPRNAEPDRFVMDVRGLRVLDFRFRVVQLNRLNWRDYMRHKNPAAAALMAKMSIQPDERARVKLQILRLLATMRLDRQKMDLIAGFMETYLTVCLPELEITTRQYGWSGEVAPGFLGRMTNDCLRFHPTIATTCRKSPSTSSSPSASVRYPPAKTPASARSARRKRRQQ